MLSIKEIQKKLFVVDAARHVPTKKHKKIL